jgi:hypothetical protein
MTDPYCPKCGHLFASQSAPCRTEPGCPWENQTTEDPVVLAVARAIHEGLGPSWAYSNYGGDEWNSMRGELLEAARGAIRVMKEN